MAHFAEIYGYATFLQGMESSGVLDKLTSCDRRFRIVESEAEQGFTRSYVSFAGEARIRGPEDDLSWLSLVEDRLKEMDFMGLTIYVDYEDAPLVSFSYFKIDDIIKLSIKVDEQVISEKKI